MLRKILSTIVLGTSLLVFVGCGAAPTEEVSVETVNNKGKEVVEVINHDSDIKEKEEENSLEEDTKYLITEDEWKEIKSMDSYEETMNMITNIKLGLGEKSLTNITKSELDKYNNNFDIILDKAKNDIVTEVKVTKKEEPNKETEVNEEINKDNNIKEPEKETNKESKYLVDTIKKSEAYTWDLYDIITQGKDLSQVESICADMINLLEGVRMEDCEYEGEYYAVQSLKDSYINMVTTIGPAVRNGISIPYEELAQAYTKINNDTLFLMNELNN